MDQIEMNGLVQMLEKELTSFSKDMLGLNLVLKAQNIINHYGILGDVYMDRPFLITTQNQHYLDRTLPSDTKDAFIILGPGDTLLELVSRDVKNITALENNDLQLLIFKLRLASFKTLSAIDYERFLIDSDSYNFLSPDVFKTVKEALKDDMEAMIALDQILSHNSKDTLMYHFFKALDYDLRANKACITYLRNKKQYYELRDKLEKAKINIALEDAICYLEKHPDAKYDYIDITNILLFVFQLACHNDKEKFATIIKRLQTIYNTNLKQKGVFVLDYWFAHTLEDLEIEHDEIQNKDGFSGNDIYKITYEALKGSFDLESFSIKSRGEDTVLLTKKR